MPPIIMLRLYWTKTGDYITLDVLHPELVIFWLDKLQDRPLRLSKSPPDIQPQEILRSIDMVNPVLAKCHLPIFDVGDPLDQRYLNNLHRCWVKIQHNRPSISLLMDKMGIRKIFDNINESIHVVEAAFDVEYGTCPFDHVVNPFGTRFLTFDRHNVEIEYGNLGRSTFNKWEVLDDVHDVDTNDYTHLAFKVKLNVQRPTAMSSNLNMIPDRLPIGDCVKTVDDLTILRRLVLRNASEQDNPISFEHHA